MTALVFSLLLHAAPCGQLEPLAPDAALSQTYLEVGAAELEAGHFETAVKALTRAASLAPENAHAKELLARACAANGHDALAEAHTLMDRKEWRRALEVLATVRWLPEPTRALLEGLCHLELGDDELATTRLELAAKDARLHDEATTLLALLGVRRGAARDAEAKMRSLGASLGAPLVGLLRQTSRSGNLLLRGAVFGGVDTNPALAVETMPAAMVGASALVNWAPWGQVSPYARLSGAWREYPTLSSLRTLAGAGTLGFQAGRGSNRVAVDYALEGSLFGLAPYSVAHGPRVEASLRLDRFILFAEWSLRVEQYLPDDSVDFSGIRQDAQVGTTLGLPGGFGLEASWALVRDDARAAELALLEHGPRLSAFFSRDRLRVTLGAAFDWRFFDAFDDDLGVQRRDLRLRPGARVELDVNDWLSVFATVEGGLLWSNVSSVTSTRVTASLGLQLWGGFL